MMLLSLVFSQFGQALQPVFAEGIEAATLNQFTISNGMPAALVLGQPDFTSATAATTQTGMYLPESVAVDPTSGKVFVAEYYNHRVLRFGSVSALANGAAAEGVLGQSDFTNGGPWGSATTQNRMGFPSSVIIDSVGRLWVADSWNCRVLRFDDAASKPNGANADGVLGQANFTNACSSPVPTQNGTHYTSGLAVDSDGRLWVADAHNHRVLRFENAASKPNGANADGVLGQPDFASNTAFTTQSGMNTPVGLVVDSAGRLWVADELNHRVLRYDNAASKPNGAFADGVLGQPDFVSNAAATTQSGMNRPSGVTVDSAGQLYVAESANNRVLSFNNAASKPNGGNADHVLGQTDFVSNELGTSATTLNMPRGLFYDPVSNVLWVAEEHNNRVLMYNTSISYTVSGTLGMAGAGAAITYTGGSTTADASTGVYSFPVNQGWTGTITPSKPGYTFSPASINLPSPVIADLPDQNFMSTPPQTYPPNLVAYWKLDEGSGTVASDSAGGNNGIVYDATWATGKINAGLHFDGTNDRIEIAHNPVFRPEGKFSVEAWIYPESNVDNQVVFSALWPAFYQVYIVNNEVVLNYYYNLTGGYYIVGSEIPSLNQWHHIVATYEEFGASATTRIFIDGIEKTSFVGEPIVRTLREGPVFIGTNHDWEWAQREFFGSIDEVALYRNALSTEEIWQHYESGLAGLEYNFTDAFPIITEGGSTSVTMSPNGSPIPFDLTLHATDADADPLTWSISSPASHGTASASGTGNSKVINYTPNTNYIGSDSFTVKVDDGNSGIDFITVNVSMVGDLPIAVAFINQNQVTGFHWPDGAQVTLTITGPGPDYTETQTSSANPTDPWLTTPTKVDFSLMGFTLLPGQLITMTDTITTKSLTVSSLSLGGVNLNDATIWGTSEPGAVIEIVKQTDHNIFRREITDDQGNWRADFSVHGNETGEDPYVIRANDVLMVLQDDNDGDHTQIDWRMLNPYIEVNPINNWVHARDWPLGTVITLTINGVDYGTATVSPRSDNPNDVLAEFNISNTAHNIIPGDVITMVGSNVTKTYIVKALQVTGYNVAEDIITGTAAENAELQVCANIPNSCISRYIIADPISGIWSANYHDSGLLPDEQQTFDLVVGSNGWVAERDENGNQTWVDWQVPNPKFAVRANFDQIEAWEWPLGSTLAVKVYPSGVETAPASCTHTGTVTGPAPWGASRNYLSFDLNGICDIQPGNLVIVSDGVTTKKHVVKTLAFDAMDATADTVSGSAAPGSNVDVWACDDTNCYNRHVTADANGKWIADWSKKGIREDEQDIFNLVVDTWVDSWQGDDDGDSTMFGNTIPNPNLPPAVNAGAPYSVNEGSTITLTASGSDPENGPLTFAWDLNNDGLFETPGQSVTFSAAQFDGPSEYTVTVKVTDSNGLSATSQAMVNIFNATPMVGTITAPLDPQQVNTSITTSAAFSDPGVLDTHTAVWDWGDNSISNGIINETNGSGSVSGSHIYTNAGVYTAKLTVTDDDGDASKSFFRYVVIYDASAGFVTGGGWINSLVGACKLTTVCEGATGKANFGFEAKYKNGANIPTGQTEFNFKAGNLNFKSIEYQWLVVAGANAQFKGSGTINGSGEYGFMLTAVDGQINGGGSVDKFRIKIWNKTTGALVYDNQLDAADDAEPTTAIGGGSIVIHK